MDRASVRTSIAALALAVALLVGTAGSALAQPTNEQSGLINVNIQDLIVEVPVSVALPVGLAANVCDVSVLSLRQGDGTCTAENNSVALSRAVADAALGTGGGGAQNRQSGLINVNVQDVIVAIPVAVAVPIGVAANVCNVSVLSLREGDGTCTAENTSQALSRALARALLG